MLRHATISGRMKTATAAVMIHLAVLMGSTVNLGVVSPAAAQMNAGAVPPEAITAARTSVTDALEAGRRVLLVELHGTTLYVFNASNNVGGPVLRVLEELGFTPVLPEGIDVGASGVTSLSIDQLQGASADHVFFLNFSTSMETVREVEGALRRISSGRLHRLDTTTSVALSDDWTESYLVPRVANAIQADG
ncbi:hypothetical protein BC360_15300 [Ensifer sp. LC163]|nr:hypothetical protein BC360_15300 [Ensifer sp. LC163]